MNKIIELKIEETKAVVGGSKVEATAVQAPGGRDAHSAFVGGRRERRRLVRPESNPSRSNRIALGFFESSEPSYGAGGWRKAPEGEMSCCRSSS